MSMLVLGYLVGGLFLLVAGGELLVRGATGIANILGISPIVIGLTVVAFGTSTPELAVSLNAAFQGNADIAVANVVGSNIFNTLFILGVCGLISPLVIHSQIIRRELPIMLGVSLLMLAFSWGGVINRFEAIVLFFGIVLYTGWLLRDAKKNRAANRELEKESAQEFSVKAGGQKLWQVLVLTAGGLGIVMLGADWLVFAAVEIAQAWGVSDTVIGLTIVAAGTSLPEVVASVIATIKGERDIAVGNVIGSNIYNLLAILGISGAIVPAGLAVDSAMLALDIPVMIFAAALCWPFFKTGRQFSRGEAGIFFAGYIAYAAFLVSQAN
jgi:cation:H+ antiporter